MNMRDGAIICIGKSNDDWNQATPHGAGQIMSRGEAKRKLSLEAMEDWMKEVWSTSICEETLDESPGAYKPMDSILDAIGDTAEILGTMKPVYNFKAAEAGEGKGGDSYIVSNVADTVVHESLPAVNQLIHALLTDCTPTNNIPGSLSSSHIAWAPGIYFSAREMPSRGQAGAIAPRGS